jgi:hypothetical protein
VSKCVDDSNRPTPHASINDNDAIADQKETLNEIQRGVMNWDYRSVHVFSDVSFAILGRPSTIPSDFLTLRIAYSAKSA